MKIQSVAETISVEDGVAQVAFDLTDSASSYLIISQPENEAAAAEFFGHDHHVEVKDQLFGRYGGLKRLRIIGAKELEVGLAFEVPGTSTNLSILTSAPMPAAIMSRLHRLERG